MTSKAGKAHARAYDLVAAALQSGAITLGGTSGGPNPQKAGENDAKYLAALLQGLTDVLTPAGSQEP